MPLQTFYNLDNSRRNEILKAAYEEFAFTSYHLASVSNIVKKLGVAKGSFYRYFENKIDLYSYLIHHAYEMRMDQLNDLLDNQANGFFDILRENFHDKIVFDLNHPLESIFLYNALQENNNDEAGSALKELFNEVNKFIINLVINYQEKGELNKAISPEIAAHFIFQSQLGLYEYLANFKGLSFKESIKSGKLFAVSEEEMMKVVDEMLVIIKTGLKA